jgi:hypothetical protein
VRISERKQRLRKRGVIPVAQQDVVRPTRTDLTARKSVTYTAGSKSRVGPGSRGAVKGGAKGAPRPRRQVSSGYQLVMGALYMTFAPLLLAFYLFQMRNPKSKTHPGAIEIGMTVLFFLFGVWQFSQGLRARRRKAALKIAESGTSTTTLGAPVPVNKPLKRPRALKSSSS